MRLLRAQRVHFLLMMVVILLNNSSLRLEAQSTDRNEFNITLDINGHIIPSPPPNPYSPSSGESQNTGYGEKWYYYPNSGRYIQWYYNDPYDPERKADIDVWILIETADPDRQFILEATYCWARPEWSLRYLDRPPLPMDVPDPNIEHMFIQNRTFPIHTTNGRKHIMGRGGTVERNFSEDIDGYNPEWVGISISGVNVHVFRWLTLDCVVDESDDEDPLILGACCNPDTGSCFQSTQLGCINPNLWLGPGTTCNECQGSAAKWDFGDAPLSYPVMRAADGAHHIWQPGIHLGGQISTEADANPHLKPTGMIMMMVFSLYLPFFPQAWHRFM